MAKSNKRSRAKTGPKASAKIAAVEEATEPVAESTPSDARAKSPKLSRSQAAAERIEDEYAYITKDLRRVLILAAAMFALLIVLNVVLGRVGG